MRALLVGNGFTSNLIPEYANNYMMRCLKMAIPELYEKANTVFAPFRMKVAVPRLTTTGWGYASDGLFAGEEPVLPGPISGLPFNGELLTHIERVLTKTGFGNEAENVCKNYFQTYGLIYETQRDEIASIESMLKIISLFEKTGQFSREDTQTVIHWSNIIYFNEGHNSLEDVDVNIHDPLKNWLSQYNYVFTTNYDCVLGDAYEDKEVMHLHGGFHYEDRYTKTKEGLMPNDAYLVWGVNGEDKMSQMQGGFIFPVTFPMESPVSLFDKYLDTLKSSEIYCMDIFGYSGENDQHINTAITSNNNLREINFYCNPTEIHSEKLRFDITERLSIPKDTKLKLISWSDVWDVLQHG